MIDEFGPPCNPVPREAVLAASAAGGGNVGQSFSIKVGAQEAQAAIDSAAAAEVGEEVGEEVEQGQEEEQEEEYEDEF